MKIAELKAVVQGMTEGPWSHSSDSKNGFTVWGKCGETGSMLISKCGFGRFDDDNAKGIAALRNHAEALLEVVEAGKAMRFKNKFDCTIVEANDWEVFRDALQKLENI